MCRDPPAGTPRVVAAEEAKEWAEKIAAGGSEATRRRAYEIVFSKVAARFRYDAMPRLVNEQRYLSTNGARFARRHRARARGVVGGDGRDRRRRRAGRADARARGGRHDVGPCGIRQTCAERFHGRDARRVRGRVEPVSRLHVACRGTRRDDRRTHASATARARHGGGMGRVPTGTPVRDVGATHDRHRRCGAPLRRRRRVRRRRVRRRVPTLRRVAHVGTQARRHASPRDGRRDERLGVPRAPRPTRQALPKSRVCPHAADDMLRRASYPPPNPRLPPTRAMRSSRTPRRAATRSDGTSTRTPRRYPSRPRSSMRSDPTSTATRENQDSCP